MDFVILCHNFVSECTVFSASWKINSRFSQTTKQAEIQTRIETTISCKYMRIRDFQTQFCVELSSTQIVIFFTITKIRIFKAKFWQNFGTKIPRDHDCLSVARVAVFANRKFWETFSAPCIITNKKSRKTQTVFFGLVKNRLLNHEYSWFVKIFGDWKTHLNTNLHRRNTNIALIWEENTILQISNATEYSN